MKTAKMLTILVLALGPAICQIKIVKAAPIGTAWTYQGRLMDANGPANGEYDLQFQLHSMPSGHFPVGDEIAVPEVSIDDGYFTIVLDFNDAKLFSGDARWLEVGVRPWDSEERYTLLSPRQEVTPTPYALYAQNAGKDNDWMISGNDMYSIASGNVGIGTTSIAEKLHVSGDIRLDAGGDIAFADDNTRIHESSDDLYLEADDDIYISPDDDIRMDGATLFVDGSENRIGIGTTVPGAPLEVKHSDWADIVKIGMSGILNRLILSSGADWASMSGGTTNQDHLVIRHSTGNVGIGTTLPAEKLHVAGNLKVDGTITSGSGSIRSPIAYGFISESAAVLKGSPNVSCTYNSTLMRYEISISGEPLDYSSHIFSLTYINIGTPRFMTGQVVDEKLIVEIWSQDGTKVIGRFHFILFKI